MYKGYRVEERIIHDYQCPETALVLDAPCGCNACNDHVQSGHEQCSASPDVLLDDPNVYKRLETGWGWFWGYCGPDKYVDKWLDIDTEDEDEE